MIPHEHPAERPSWRACGCLLILAALPLAAAFLAGLWAGGAFA